jgi:predicted DsbA family dithiol-disulfide isomerase
MLQFMQRPASPSNSIDLDLSALTSTSWDEKELELSADSGSSDTGSSRSAPLLYSPRTLKLTVWQDPGCPCCYISDREMDKAIACVREREGDVGVEVEYKPFIVDPSLPFDKPVNRQEMWKNRYGARYEDIRQRMQTRGEEIGIDFNFAGPTRSSLNAHRLVMHAHDIGGGEAQHALLEQIHRSVLEQCQDVGCTDVLSTCAEKAGIMSKADALAFLKSPLLFDRVHDEIVIARTERGIVGLPFTVVDDKWALSGGQSADVYEQIFMKVLKKEIMA